MQLTIESDNALFAQVTTPKHLDIYQSQQAKHMIPRWQNFVPFVIMCLLVNHQQHKKLYHHLKCSISCFISATDKRKTGGRGKVVPSGAFDLADYNSVMTKYKNKPREQWSPPENPLGYSQINTYKSSIKQLFKTQVASMANRWT